MERCDHEERIKECMTYEPGEECRAPAGGKCGKSVYGARTSGAITTKREREKTMKKVAEFFAAVAGAIISFFTTLPPLVWILIAVMSIDFLTGMICGIMGKSKKTETGYLASHAAFIGLMKKVLILLVVMLAELLDRAVSNGAGIQFAAVMGATCLWFIASEGLSILENVASMGIPIPKILLKVLEIMREKGDVPDQPAEQTQTEEQPDETLEE